MFVEKTIEFGNDLVTALRFRQCDRDVWLDFYGDRIVLNVGSEQVTFKAGVGADRQVIAMNGDRK
jgi:extradiol dioxygenase family protein